MKQLHLVMAALSVLTISSCSSGGGGGSSAVSTTSGMVTGFGSVYVNGVRYDSSGATIQMDGVASNESQLQVGMVVNLQGAINADGTTGTASAISYNDIVEGVVLTVQLTNGVGTVNVMGQTVKIDTLTIFHSNVAGVALNNIPLGSVAEVSGFTDGTGSIYATRLEIKHSSLQPGTPLEAKGVVSNLTDTTFQIGSLVVDYSGAALLPALVDGLYVEVKGSSAPIDNGNGTYTFAATAVEVEDDGSFGIGGADGDDLHMQGVVMALDAGASTIVVNGQLMAVRADAMREGLILADLALGTYIKLEAERTDGQWLVKEIEVGRSCDVEITSVVEAIDLVAGSVTVMGHTIMVDSSTILLDSKTAAQHYFDLADLQVGDRVEVDVSIQGVQWRAARLVREDAHAGATLEGRINALSPVQIVGITVTGLEALGVVPSMGLALELTGTWDGATFHADSALSK